MSNVDSYPYLSVCSGIGGLDLGLKRALPGARAICYVEREISAALVLGARMQEKQLDEAPIWSDLATFDGKPWRGKVGGIVGGYPCQPFSFAGSRAGKHDSRHLWPHISRIIEECEPEWCFFENVPGHVTLGYYDTVRPALESYDFRVAETLIEAADVGAPHKRQRLFILAAKQSAAERIAEAVVFPDARLWSIDGAQYVDVADASCEGWRQEQAGYASISGSKTESCGSKVVYPECERLQGELWPGCAYPQGREVEDGSSSDASNLLDAPGYLCFPPAPQQFEAWRAVLGRFPLLAPAIEPELCGVAHGPAAGVDIPSSARLQLLGNAVVPLQAWLAFAVLARVLSGEIQNHL
ncbi:MAG: DNA cytosine methyltransferase [Candidatus Hadarchaeum sp.]